MTAPSPMLAELTRELPIGDYLYEPKWDGFRCIASVHRGNVELWSRNERPFSRYFPEIVEALAPLPDCTLDGELLVTGPGGSDFGALLNRLHPSRTRVLQLRAQTPASLVVFDLLSVGSEDLTRLPFVERRARLEALQLRLPVVPTPVTQDPALAQSWLSAPEGKGIDGVMAKRRDGAYEPGRRGWLKVKEERTVECVVGGFRPTADARGVASLLLGVWNAEALLVHVGVSSSFKVEQRRALFEELLPLATRLEGHPWQHGFNLGNSPIGRLPGSAGRWVAGEMTQDWVPLRPERVCEVAYDKLDGFRFRHPARLVRFRPDRDPRSCSSDQLR